MNAIPISAIPISDTVTIEKVTDKHIVISDEETGEVALSEGEAIRVAQVIMVLFDVRSIVLGSRDKA